MPANNSAATVASAWVSDLVRKTLSPLQAPTMARLLNLEWIASLSDPSTGAAALIARMQTDYAAGDSIDEIARKFEESITPEHLPDPEVLATVELASLMVRSATPLVDPVWWEPALKAELFAIACVRGEVDRPTDISELLGHRLWWFPEAVDHIKTLAAGPGGAAFVGTRNAEAERELQPYLDLPEVTEQVTSAARSMLASGGGRADLVFLAAQHRQLRTFHAIATQHGLEATSSWLTTQGEHFAAAIKSLSGLEMELLVPREPDYLLLAAAADAGKYVRIEAPERGSAVDGGTVAPLPDLIGGTRRVPPSLSLMLGLGTQGFQQRSGPIVHWSVVFEGEVPEGLERGILGFAVEPGEGSIRISFAIGEGPDAIQVPIVYPLPGSEAAVDLALLLLTKRLRVDFFVRDHLRAIRHVSQLGLVLPDPFLADVKVRAMPAIADLLDEGVERARLRLRAELRPPDPTEPLASGVLVNEQGKSEQLVDVLRPGASLGPRRELADGDRDELLDARRAMWEAQAERVEAPTDETLAAAAQADTALTRLVQTLRGKAAPSRQRTSLFDEVAALTAGVATADAAVLHLGTGPAGLDLLWVDQSGGLHVDSPDVDVDVEALRAALEEPELSLAVLDAPGGVGEALGRAIAKKAAERGIGRLTICPSRWLHRLPVHALRTGDGDARLLDVIDVVYAPSANLVRDLASHAPRTGGTLVAAVGLDHAGDEARLVSELVQTADVLIENEADPSRVLSSWSRASRVHVCAHGQYNPRDFWASHLVLAPVDAPRGRLSIARLLADGDFHGTDLAVLAACFSGAGETEDSALDVAGGIDSSLLAAGVRNVVSALWSVDDLAALLFNAAFYSTLDEGGSLLNAYRAGVDLLRSGRWREIRSTSLGNRLQGAGVDLDSAFVQLDEDSRSDDGDEPIDFSAIEYWAPFRLAGVGRLWADSKS